MTGDAARFAEAMRGLGDGAQRAAAGLRALAEVAGNDGEASEAQNRSEALPRLFWVAGRPRTKGSLKPVHKRLGNGRCSVALTESGEYAVAWKRTMIATIRDRAECSRYPGAVTVDLDFLFERLCVPDQELPWPTRQSGEFGHGDVDKLTRNVYDALTQSGFLLDDSLIVGGVARKRFATVNEIAGVWITIRAAEL